MVRQNSRERAEVEPLDGAVWSIICELSEDAADREWAAGLLGKRPRQVDTDRGRRLVQTILEIWRDPIAGPVLRRMVRRSGGDLERFGRELLLVGAPRPAQKTLREIRERSGGDPVRFLEELAAERLEPAGGAADGGTGEEPEGAPARQRAGRPAGVPDRQGRRDGAQQHGRAVLHGDAAARRDGCPGGGQAWNAEAALQRARVPTLRGEPVHRGRLPAQAGAADPRTRDDRHDVGHLHPPVAGAAGRPGAYGRGAAFSPGELTLLGGRGSMFSRKGLIFSAWAFRPSSSTLAEAPLDQYWDINYTAFARPSGKLGKRASRAPAGNQKVRRTAPRSSTANDRCARRNLVGHPCLSRQVILTLTRAACYVLHGWEPQVVKLAIMALCALTLAALSEPADAQVPCTITEDTRLEQDLSLGGIGGCGNGLTLVGPASLDLNGHSITCGDCSPVVLVTGRRARLHSGRLSPDMQRFTLVLSGEGKHYVHDIETGRSEGIAIVSPMNTISGNRIRGRTSAVDILSEKNQIYNNDIVADINPIWVAFPKNQIHRNRILTIQGSGITVYGLGSNTRIKNNTITTESGLDQSREAGIEFSTDNNHISHNDVSAYEEGIVAREGAERNQIIANESTDNDGFDLVDENFNCDRNHWIRNTFDTANQECIFGRRKAWPPLPSAPPPDTAAHPEFCVSAAPRDGTQVWTRARCRSRAQLKG